MDTYQIGIIKKTPTIIPPVPVSQSFSPNFLFGYFALLLHNLLFLHIVCSLLENHAIPIIFEVIVSMMVNRFFFTRTASMAGIFRQSILARTRVGMPLKPAPLTNFFRGTATFSPAVKNTTSTTIRNVNADPIVTSKAVGWWLLGTSGLVFGIVVLGGLTRLTESGLSITEWRPVTGSIPPLNQEQWQEEFDKYKNSPEFKQLNSHITLEEFKFIFSMEWGHRFVGRCIGAFFILPAIYFWKRKMVSRHVKWRIVGLTGLLGLQGFIGWWMVKSGLDEEQLAARKSKPTVSQYRLTAHLGAAFLMYLGVLWTGFEVLIENKWIKQADASVEKILTQLQNPALRKLRNYGTALLILTYFTAMSGGMVAGLDAGLIYNTFPHMGDDWIPNSGELMLPVFARKSDHSDLWWRNLLENPTTVQLVHRCFATTTFFSVLALHMYGIKRKAIVPVTANKALHAVMGLVSLQVALGITTLIYLVPIPLAAAHQAGALALLTGALAFSARLKKPRPEVVSLLKRTIQKPPAVKIL